MLNPGLRKGLFCYMSASWKYFPGVRKWKFLSDILHFAILSAVRSWALFLFLVWLILLHLYLVLLLMLSWLLPVFWLGIYLWTVGRFSQTHIKHRLTVIVDYSSRTDYMEAVDEILEVRNTYWWPPWDLPSVQSGLLELRKYLQKYVVHYCLHLYIEGLVHVVRKAPTIVLLYGICKTFTHFLQYWCNGGWLIPAEMVAPWEGWTSKFQVVL